MHATKTVCLTLPFPHNPNNNDNDKSQMIWLGHNFNQQVEKVDWPPSLKQLRFGHKFNQDVERVRWPRCLEVRTENGEGSHSR